MSRTRLLARPPTQQLVSNGTISPSKSSMFIVQDRALAPFRSSKYIICLVPTTESLTSSVISQKYLFIYCPVLGIGTFLPFDIDAQDNRDNLFRFDYWCQRAPSSPKNTSSFGAQDRAIGTFSPQRLVTKTGPLVRFPLRWLVPNGTVSPHKICHLLDAQDRVIATFFPPGLVPKTDPLTRFSLWWLVPYGIVTLQKCLICFVSRTGP